LRQTSADMIYLMTTRQSEKCHGKTLFLRL
jgi:hypothetical protein